jgi:hypothetical protein
VLQTILKAAQAAYEASNPVKLMEGEVVTAPPNLSIKLKQNTKLIISKELIVVAEHLTRHKRIVSLVHDEMAPRNLGDKEVNDYLNTDDKIPPYTHYAHNCIEMQFEDVLKVGDSVLIASLQGGQKFYILDRIVTY